MSSSPPTMALVWDLDSLLPHPETDTFTDLLHQFQEDLTNLAGRSDGLPRVDATASTVGTWVAFLRDYEDLDGRASDLASFVGCHAAADMERAGVGEAGPRGLARW